MHQYGKPQLLLQSVLITKTIMEEIMRLIAMWSRWIRWKVRVGSEGVKVPEGAFMQMLT